MLDPSRRWDIQMEYESLHENQRELWLGLQLTGVLVSRLEGTQMTPPLSFLTCLPPHPPSLSDLLGFAAPEPG